MVQALAPTEKKTLLLVYPCYLCDGDGPTYQKAARLIMHIRDQHGFLLPSRHTGVRRPANRHYNYQTDMKIKWDEQQNACPSCWYHTDALEELSLHISKEHDPPACEPLSQHNDASSRRGTRRRSAGSNASPFVYDGSKYEKKTVNTIFKQMNEITTLFKDILRMD
ncbi:hypothetical protein BDF20DRAFT_910407 [Mycotypha africana]|uniref:uncharacterized protein n=1 Tax=Mycotypha africana TaxID=64632 RepID=UPI0022FFCD90|nr:uncharacterized protein BDF20DRAFT_910407 [Mycotypha africana]KAI8987860.1 hypothetical protein BDF20DRAFT_910407 [Mycotypha africana]